MLLFGLSATEVRASDLLKELQTRYVASAKRATVSGLPFRISGIRRRLLQPRQPHQSHGARLRFRQEGRPGRRDGREQPIPRSRKDQDRCTASCPRTRSIRGPFTPIRATCTGCRKRRSRDGAKHLFIVWFDGLDWPTTQAAAIVKSGKVYTEGKGSGLVFQDYSAGGSAQYGFVVTSPTHDKSIQDVDRQLVSIPPDSMGGGYDARIAGPNPWTLGPLGSQALGYFKGQSADEADRAGVRAAGRVLHAYTDSSQSAAELVSGVKSYNSGLNITDDSRLVPTLFHELQDQGWKTGTVTSVPFCHASPAGMYVQNVERDDYQDIARAMLGLPGIIQEARQARLYPGLDVVIGTGYGIPTNERNLKIQGRNGVPGKLFLTDADRAAIDVKNGGKYVCVQTEIGANGGQAILRAAATAARSGGRLFGFFGTPTLDHLPYRTADGRYDPAPSLDRKGNPIPAETYSASDLESQPTLAQMTEAALAVLSARPRSTVHPVRGGGRRRFRPPRQQPRQRDRCRL